MAAALMGAACAAGPGVDGGPVSAGDAPAGPPPGASPSEVYHLQQAYFAQLADRMQVAEAEIVRLMRLEQKEEFERLEAEVGAMLQSDSLAPFYTESALQKLEEWDALPVEDRFGMYGMVMQVMLPSEFEVMDETLDGGRATLRVRGYFETPLMEEPVWQTGEVRLAREDGEWRIVKESWGDS